MGKHISIHFGDFCFMFRSDDLHFNQLDCFRSNFLEFFILFWKIIYFFIFWIQFTLVLFDFTSLSFLLEDIHSLLQNVKCSKCYAVVQVRSLKLWRMIIVATEFQNKFTWPNYIICHRIYHHYEYFHRVCLFTVAKTSKNFSKFF